MKVEKKNKTYYMELTNIEKLTLYKKQTGVKQSETVNRALKEFFEKHLHIEK
ncbi:hypothetical protein CPT_Silence40 [Bacillus phage Silence]|nr:hypothetical protein CPT_Silence40 [Bacillus phage Silence]